MKISFLLLVPLALAVASLWLLSAVNPLTAKSTQPSRNERLKTAINKNVQWLLNGIRDRTFDDLSLAQAVVAIFLAKPEFFSPGHEIGQDLKNTVPDFLFREFPRQRVEYLNFRTHPFVPATQLASYVQAFLALCVDPTNFYAYDMLSALWRSLAGDTHRISSPVLLALCNAGATSPLDFKTMPRNFNFICLSEEELFFTMSIACLESQSPWNIPEVNRTSFPVDRSCYYYSKYPSDVTVESVENMVEAEEYLLMNSTYVAEVASATQILMHNRRLKLSDLPPSVVDFFLTSQDEEGSWGQSVENSLLALPVLSNKSFLNISWDHCPAESGNALTAKPRQPSRNERLKTAINKNVRWLLNGIANKAFEDLSLAQAVVALFLAKPELFSPGNEIGQDLRNSVPDLLKRSMFGERSALIAEFHKNPFVPTAQLASYVQAFLALCVDPTNFYGYDMLAALWRSLGQSYKETQILSSPVLLALCNAGATSPLDFRVIRDDSINLSEEELFITMSIACLESQSPWNISDGNRTSLPIRRSGYSSYPSDVTVESVENMIEAGVDLLKNSTYVAEVASAIQILMHNRRLKLSDLPPSVVDFFLTSQDQDGSWGQSVENSLLALPVLSNKSFLNISWDHCPAESGNEEYANEMTTDEGTKNYRSLVLFVRDDHELKVFTIFNAPPKGNLRGFLPDPTYSDLRDYNGTDGKPYLSSLMGIANNPETGYSWYAYAKTTFPKPSMKLLTQSHAEIKMRCSLKYIMWYKRSPEYIAEEDQIVANNWNFSKKDD